MGSGQSGPERDAADKVDTGFCLEQIVSPNLVTHEPFKFAALLPAASSIGPGAYSSDWIEGFSR